MERIGVVESLPVMATTPTLMVIAAPRRGETWMSDIFKPVLVKQPVVEGRRRSAEKRILPDVRVEGEEEPFGDVIRYRVLCILVCGGFIDVTLSESLLCVRLTYFMVTFKLRHWEGR